MRLLVCGGRNYTDAKALNTRLDALVAAAHVWVNEDLYRKDRGRRFLQFNKR